MDARKRSYVGLLCVLATLGHCSAVDNSCIDLGYTSNLMCSSCRELREFNLQDLEEECKQCCQPDRVSADDKVAAILGVYSTVLGVHCALLS